MSIQDFKKFVADHAPKEAQAYRLLTEASGQMVAFPSPPAPGLKVHPVELPALASGSYAVSYEDQHGKALLYTAEPVEWHFPAKKATEVEPKKELETEGDDARLSLEMEQTAADASVIGSRAQSVKETLGVYRGFTQVLGTQSAYELRVKNEQIDLLGQATKKLLETQVDLMETFRQAAANLRTPPPPPPPPQWDKIVAAAAPAFAAMYVETVRAIKGESRKGKGPSTADLLTPVDEKLRKLYELLGNVASNERLEVLLNDQAKLKMWLESVQSFMADGPKADDAGE